MTAAAARRCRVCGCTEDNACVDPAHGPCWWIEDDLCSHCGEPMIVAGEYDRFLRLPSLDSGDLQAFALWGRKARTALERAASCPAEDFDV